jgi:hypothetical protein
MYIILIPEKEKKRFSLFHFFFEKISHNQVYIKQWLVDCISILLVCAKHIHDRIISLRQEVCTYTCNFTPPLFNEMPVSRQEV